MWRPPPGGMNLYNAPTTVPSVTEGGLPGGRVTLYARLCSWSVDTTTRLYNEYTYTSAPWQTGIHDIGVALPQVCGV